MAWPKDLSSVKCVGFRPEGLFIIKAAIDNGRVEWGKSSLYASCLQEEFDFLGFRYELLEHYELVTEIRKIAKVDVATNGETVVVELLDRTPQIERGEDWGGW